MAGDWIKMRTGLHTHPKVVRISSALRADRLRVVGGLHAVWCLFDSHAIDGKLDGYTAEALDEMIGFPGFTKAMESVEWIEVGTESLAAPRFDNHNGQSAKRRATETERKRNDRKASATEADKKRTREEKRREEKDIGASRFDALKWLKENGVSDAVSKDWLTVRKGKKQANTEIAFAQVKKEAANAKIPLNDALTISVQKSWAGFNVKWLDETTTPTESWAANISAGGV